MNIFLWRTRCSVQFIWKTFVTVHVLLQLEDFEDTKWAKRIHKSKDRQHIGQKKKDKQRSKKHTHQPKDRVAGTPLKTGGELGCSGSVSISCSTGGIRYVTCFFVFKLYLIECQNGVKKKWAYPLCLIIFTLIHSEI